MYLKYYNDSLIIYSLGNFYFDSGNYYFSEDQTYSVILKIERNKSITVNPVFHYNENHEVRLAPIDKRIDIDYLNKQLAKNYEGHHDEMCLKVYESIIKKNLIYALAPIPYDGTIKGSLYKIKQILLNKQKKADKTMLQLHLLRNESYYYATKNALDIIIRRRDE